MNRLKLLLLFAFAFSSMLCFSQSRWGVTASADVGPVTDRTTGATKIDQVASSLGIAYRQELSQRTSLSANFVYTSIHFKNPEYEDAWYCGTGLDDQQLFIAQHQLVKNYLELQSSYRYSLPVSNSVRSHLALGLSQKFYCSDKVAVELIPYSQNLVSSADQVSNNTYFLSGILSAGVSFDLLNAVSLEVEPRIQFSLLDKGSYPQDVAYGLGITLLKM